MKYKLLSLLTLLTIPVIFLTFTAQANAYASDPGLQAKINQVWGNTPDGQGGYYGGVTYYDCFLFWCTYRVYILPNYSDDLNVIAHEGGHTICFQNWRDSSEACADNVARKYYPSYPY